MKNIVLSFSFLVALFTGLDVVAQTATTIEIGEHAPSSSNKMMVIDGTTVSIDDIVGEKGALVIFTCNSCPFVVGRGKTTEGWEGRYNEVIALAAKNGIGTLLVNSNEAKRDGYDSISKMKIRARNNGYSAPYVVDEGSKLANEFGALTTPHIFLFNAELALIYKGSIDDNVDNASEVEEHFLRTAIERHAVGKRIKNNSTRAIGCSIKRVK
jgi:hypothetical protein